EGVGAGIDDPTERHHDAAERDDQPGSAPYSETIGDPTVDWRQPSLERNEDAERKLDRCDRPAMRLVDRVDEERPTVLQVGDQNHAGDAAEELYPACARRRRNRAFRPACDRCHYSSP